MGGCLTLTICGGVTEIVGFALVFYEVVDTQRREFPEYVPIHHRTARWLRRKLGRARSGTAHLSGGGSVTTSGHAVLTVTRAPATSLEERVDRLEQEIRDVRRESSEAHAALDQRVTAANTRITDAETSLRTQLDEMEAARKETLRDTILFEKLGTGLFVVGVILSVLGNAISC